MQFTKSWKKVIFISSSNSKIFIGTLKKEFTETQLLEIREYHLRLEKYKSETIKKIDESFREIINTLKKRKNEIISEALDKFNLEKEKVLKEEDKW